MSNFIYFTYSTKSLCLITLKLDAPTSQIIAESQPTIDTLVQSQQPQEVQPILIDKTIINEDHHILTPLLHPNPSGIVNPSPPAETLQINLPQTHQRRSSIQRLRINYHDDTNVTSIDMSETESKMESERPDTQIPTRPASSPPCSTTSGRSKSQASSSSGKSF